MRQLKKTYTSQTFPKALLSVVVVVVVEGGILPCLILNPLLVLDHANMLIG